MLDMKSPFLAPTNSRQMGAIQFIENLDRTSLTISDEEFEKNVEAAVSAITEGHEQAPSPPPRPPRQPSHVHISEKSGISPPEVIPRNSVEVRTHCKTPVTPA